VADPALAEPPEDTPPCPPAANPPEAEPLDVPNPEDPTVPVPAPVPAPFELAEPFELPEVFEKAVPLDVPFEAGAPVEPATVQGAPHAATDSATATAIGAIPRIRRFWSMFMALFPLVSLIP